MKAMIKIKVGEPQPVPCDKCKGIYGYGYVDRIVINYQREHLPDGTFEQGSYSEYSRTLNEGKLARCINCGSNLNFKLERHEGELMKDNNSLQP